MRINSYAPYFFVSEPYHAIAIGVGMHWCQYLALNYKVYAKENGSIKFDVNFLYTIIFVIAYAFIMTFIETLGFKEINVREGTLILIFPLFGQILHYYYDAFIWRFSDPHIRNIIAKELFK